MTITSGVSQGSVLGPILFLAYSVLSVEVINIVELHTPYSTCKITVVHKGLKIAVALLHLIDDLSQSIDDGKITAGVFVDLAKAFDTVNHAILLNKLQHYGIRGITLKWFESYLLDRKQFVVVNKACSGIAQVRCGVPQGSILGPLLFILYMNDFNYISNLLKIVMFADDTNLFLTGKDCREIESLFDRKLQCISEWFTSNRLSLNVSKTLYLVFSNKK